MRPESAGKRFGPYLIQGEIAQGGQGKILRATTADGRPCALKMLTARRPGALARFRQEGKVLATLSHPHLLRVTDLGEHNGIAFLAMEFVDGRDLERHVAALGIPAFEWSARVLGRIAHALHTCHAQGLIHRDLKPENVLIEAGSERPVLVDFGLVKRDPEHMKLSVGEGPLSHTGEIKGTPRYMAPEQASPQRFGEVSPRSDVYGLGACLYFLLTGRPPFDGSSLVNVMAKVIADPPPNPRAANPRIPAPLAAFCRRCLSKAASERPESAEAFARELAVLTGQEAWLPTFPRSAAPALPKGEPLGARNPRALGPYTLLSMLGKGAMGAVFLGRHRVLGVPRAIKAMQTLTGPKRTQRFEREIVHLAGIRHPNVVAIHDSGRHELWKWFAMDLVDGQSLDDVVKTGPLPWERAVRICAEIAQGLGALHRAGVVHRDVKPANVVLAADGRAVVVDLGLAIAPELDGRLTKTGALVGTPLYVAPEQIAGSPPDPRADVYATGLILHELLTGQAAIEDGELTQILAQIINGPSVSPSGVVSDLPPAVEALCLRAIAKDPQERPADGNALASELLDVLASGPRRQRFGGLRRAHLVGLAAVAGLAITLGIGLTHRTAVEPDRVVPPGAKATGGAKRTDETGATPRAKRPRALSEGELRDAERALRRAKRGSTPQAVAAALRDWLKTYEGHPEVDAVRALRHATQRQFPFRTLPLPRSRGTFLTATRLVTRTLGDAPYFVRVWDLQREDPFVSSHQVPFYPVTVETSPDHGSVFVGGGQPGQVLRFDAKGTVLSVFRFDGLILDRIAVSPDGSELAVAARQAFFSSHTCQIVDANSGALLREFELRVPGEIADLAYSSDGKRLIAPAGQSVLQNDYDEVDRMGNAVLIVSAATGQRFFRIEFPAKPAFVAVEPETSAFLTGTGSGRLVLLDSTTGATLREFTAKDANLGGKNAPTIYNAAMSGGIRGGAFSVDGSQVYSVAGETAQHRGSFAVWDRASGERLRVAESKALMSIARSPDGSTVAISRADEAIELWRTDE